MLKVTLLESSHNQILRFFHLQEVEISGREAPCPWSRPPCPSAHTHTPWWSPAMARGLTRALLLPRLVGDEERRWTDENIDMVALKHFPNIDKERATSRPILYSNWLSKVRTAPPPSVLAVRIVF